MIRRFRDEFGMTVIVSSHILGELENTADRFGIVHNGVIAREITQDDLSAKRPEVELTVSAGNLERAKSIIDTYDLTNRCHVYLSPVFGSIEPVDMVDYMIKNNMNDVRLQIQLHKVIWDPNKRGV